LLRQLILPDPNQISENALRKEQGLGARVLSCYTLKKEL
jgi:hypothetical protein